METAGHVVHVVLLSAEVSGFASRLPHWAENPGRASNAVPAEDVQNRHPPQPMWKYMETVLTLQNLK